MASMHMQLKKLGSSIEQYGPKTRLCEKTDLEARIAQQQHLVEFYAVH
jgi:hypothetical protein